MAQCVSLTHVLAAVPIWLLRPTTPCAWVKCWQDCLVGFDIDPLAVLATKLNLMLDHGATHEAIAVEEANSLTEVFDLDLQADGFDLVMTNPPWGARLSKRELRTLSPALSEIRSKESFLSSCVPAYDCCAMVELSLTFFLHRY